MIKQIIKNWKKHQEKTIDLDVEEIQMNFQKEVEDEYGIKFQDSIIKELEKGN